MESEIKYSILHKQIVELSYDGYSRTVEPHVYGRKNNELQLLCYQIGGQSKSGRIPEWRLFKVDKISNYTITAKSFPGPRSSNGPHTAFDVILALV